VLSAAAMLAGCGSPNPPPAQPARIYANVDECARERPRAECDRAWAEAQNSHMSNAQAFSSRAECEQQWGTGHCETYHSRDSDWFIPALAGFMIARAMTPTAVSCRTGDPGCPQGSYSGHGVYFGSGGTLYSENERIGTAQASGSGYVMPRSATFAEGSRFGTSGATTRGGFGETFGMRGGGRG
jgi:uncharacterized protein YgiB involved in biofilm formation